MAFTGSWEVRQPFFTLLWRNRSTEYGRKKISLRLAEAHICWEAYWWIYLLFYVLRWTYFQRERIRSSLACPHKMGRAANLIFVEHYVYDTILSHSSDPNPENDGARSERIERETLIYVHCVPVVGRRCSLGVYSSYIQHTGHTGTHKKLIR